MNSPARFRITFSAFLFLLTLVNGQLSSCPQPKLLYTAPNIQPGYLLTKLADNFTHPRQIVVDGNDNLVLSSLGDGIVGLRTVYDASGCPSLTERKILVPDNGLNFSHSVVLSADDSTLFASTPDVALAWDYDSENLQVNGSAQVIVKGMALKDSISITRAMAVPSQYPDLLLVFRGEANDFDYSTTQLTSGRAMIKIFNLTTVPDGGYDFTSDGVVFAYGVRDTLSFDEDQYNNFWNVDNGADAITRYGVSVTVHNPADELNLLGNVSPDTLSTDAANYGFPYCHTVWNASEIPKSTLNLRIGEIFSTLPNVTSDATCNNDTIPPALSILPHSAPLGIRFYNPDTPSLGDDLVNFAFVSYHGPTGHKVVIVPFGDVPVPTPRDPIDFIWTDKSVNLTNCKSQGNRGPTAVECFSPVGLAYDSNGYLYITSDQTGEVFVVTADTSAY